MRLLAKILRVLVAVAVVAVVALAMGLLVLEWVARLVVNF